VDQVTGTFRMVAEPRLALGADAPAAPEPQPVYLVGRLVSLRFVTAALRRRRKLWLGLAALGLLLGVGYHVVVPRQYGASTTLYLAHVPGTDDAVDMSNDMALLQTTAVGQRAVDILGEPHLSPAKLLGKAPGIAKSQNVLEISVSGPTKAEAVHRANALAKAFLAFRADQNRQQTQASVNALQKQIDALNSQINQFTEEINGLSSAAQSAKLDTLVVDRSADTNEVVTLEQSVEQDQLDNLAVASGSRVLTPGAADASSTVKLFGLAGISGLVVGLTIGVGIVAVQALFSDRLRSREEVASLLGAPVDLSVRPARRHLGSRRRWVRHMALRPSANVGTLAGYFRERCVTVGGAAALVVVAADRTDVPAAALAAVAAGLAAEGKSVVLVDMTNDQILAGKTVTAIKKEVLRAQEGTSADVSLAGEVFFLGEAEGTTDPRTVGADFVLVLATVDPGLGAWQLGWAREAVITVSAGRSSAQHLSAIAELVRAAGVSIAAGVLLDADANDETVGLLKSGEPTGAQPLQFVPASPTWK